MVTIQIQQTIMDYVAGLVLLGAVAVLFIAYRIAQKAFVVLFVMMFAHAYLLLVDKVYPEVSLLRIVKVPLPCSLCYNHTLPFDNGTASFNLTETMTDVASKLEQQIPQGWQWKEWLASKLPFSSSATLPAPATTTSQHEDEDRTKREFEEFQRWKAATKKEL